MASDSDRWRPRIRAGGLVVTDGWLIVPAVAAAGAGLVALGRRAGRRAVGHHGPVAVARRNLAYQPPAVAIAVVTVAAGRLLVADHPNRLRVGDLGAPASGLGVLGMGDGQNWTDVGLSFAGTALAVTAAVVFFQTRRGGRLQLAQLPLAALVAVPAALVNAGVEEAIFRVAPAEALGTAVASGQLSAGTVALVSAALFGVPHWLGSPGGAPGVAMAGFLGWLLQLSVIQTGGVAWAYGLHVLLDVVILALHGLSAPEVDGPTIKPAPEAAEDRA